MYQRTVGYPDEYFNAHHVMLDTEELGDGAVGAGKGTRLNLLIPTRRARIVPQVSNGKSYFGFLNFS